MPTIAYLGPQGTFGEAAALCWKEARGRVGADLLPKPTHIAVLKAVEAGEVEEGVVAIGNSIDGELIDELDYLLNNAPWRIRITGEIILDIDQCLFVPRGVSLEDVQVIYSHPKAFGQCKENTHRLFGDRVRTGASLSTAAAVEDMLKAEVPAAAIAPCIAGPPEKVELVEEKFQDYPNNKTRFLVLGKNGEVAKTGRDKTTLAFGLKNKPLALAQVLLAFGLLGINFSMIHSRPTKKRLGEYEFLADVEDHVSSLRMRGAQGIARRFFTTSFRVLGSYPRWTNEI